MTIDTINEHPHPHPHLHSSTTPAPTRSLGRTWEDVHAEVRNSIVAISIIRPFGFGAVGPTCSCATGFVVDSDQGIILSNRHVLEFGPGIHKATFDTNEFVYLQPVHYDPIHDFAFFRYDPAALKYTQPKAIRLFPEGARPGVPFQIIGNSAGEKMTVCAGTLSQINRNTPNVGDNRDSNTFYYQASTTSAGGSSGSPLLDINGAAIAIKAAKNINDGGSFFLPLERVVYSLKYMRRGERAPRGTIQAVFVFETYQEVQRLGLAEQEIEESRLANPKSEGMIVVDKILHKGPAYGALEVGDIVISMDGKPICDFVGLESVLDANVGCTVDFVVWRKGTSVPVSVRVQDMYDVSPTQLLSLGHATLHDMSLMLANRYSLEVKGVYIATMSEEFLPAAIFKEHRIIMSVNGIPTPDLTALLGIFRTIQVGQSMVIKAIGHINGNDHIVTIATLPGDSGPFRVLTRDIESGFWSEERIEMCCGAIRGDSQDMGGSIPHLSFTDGHLVDGHSNLDRVWQSIVHITSSRDGSMDETCEGTVDGNGVVLDRSNGIVVCSAAVFTGSASNISITIRNTFQIAATIVYIHPLYPLIFLKYDPSDLGPAGNGLVSDLPVDSNYWRGEACLTVGQDVVLIGANKNGSPYFTKTHISDRYLYDGTKHCKKHYSPSHFNVDLVSLAIARDSESMSGVLCSADGYALGLWIHLPLCGNRHNPDPLVGLDVSHLREITKALRSSNEYPDIVRTLNAKFAKVRLSTACKFGLTSRWVEKFAASPTCGNCLFQVHQIDIKSAVKSPGVEVGDIILSIDGKLVSRIDDVATIYGKDAVDLVILRQGQEVAITVRTVPPHETNTRRVLRWSGLTIQEPYVSIYRYAHSVPSKCLIYGIAAGSPARWMKNWPAFITEVNDEKVEDMDDLVRIICRVKGSDSGFNAAVAAGTLDRRITSPPGCDVKFRLVDTKGIVYVYKFRTDDHYLQAWQRVRGNGVDAKWRWEAI